MSVWDVEDLADARRAVWDDDDWDGGIALCIERIGDLSGAGVVVDVGCGIGRLLWPLASRYPNVEFIGIDPSAQMLEHAAEVTSGLPNVTLILGGVFGLAKIDGFDVAYSTVTMQHLSTVEQRAWIAGLAVSRLPGARVSMQFVCGEAEETAPLNNPIESEALLDWFRTAGFGAVECSPVEQFPTWSWIDAR